MPRSAVELLVVLLPLAGGCTFSEGVPWGHLDLTAEAAFVPSAARQEGDRFKTPGYTVAFDTLTATIASVGVTVAAGAGDLSFDPANPPEGYTLCHGGHCHSDDGRLVSYEDVQAELLASSGGGADGVRRVSYGGASPLGSVAVALDLEACEPCDLPRGTVAQADAVLTAFSVSGRAFDRADTGDPTLPEDGLPFYADVTAARTLRVDLDEAIDTGEPLGLAVHLVIGPGETFLDRVDFETLAEAWDGATPIDLGDDETQVSAMIEAFGAVSVTTERFDWTPQPEETP